MGVSMRVMVLTCKSPYPSTFVTWLPKDGFFTRVVGVEGVEGVVLEGSTKSPLITLSVRREADREEAEPIAGWLN
jgi:hypothetical protein